MTFGPHVEIYLIRRHTDTEIVDILLIRRHIDTEIVDNRRQTDTEIVDIRRHTDKKKCRHCEVRIRQIVIINRTREIKIFLRKSI